MACYSWIKFDPSSLPLRSMSGLSCKVFLALCSQMDENGKSAVSYGALVSSLGISRRSAIRSVVELEKLDLLVRVNGQGQILTVIIKRAAAVGRSQQPSRIAGSQDHQFHLVTGAK